MTSTTSSFSIAAQIGAQLRRYGWLLGISIILHLLVGPLMAYFAIKGRLISEQYMAPEIGPTTLHWDLFVSFHQSSWILLYIGAVLTGTGLAAIFGYSLKSKRQANFYHALPVRRGQWMLAHLLTALVFYAFILLFIVLGYGILFMGFQGYIALELGRIFTHLGLLLFYFILAYALTMLAGSLTGHVIAQLALSFVFQFGSLMLFAVLMILFGEEFDTYQTGQLADFFVQVSVPGSISSVFSYNSNLFDNGYNRGLWPLSFGLVRIMKLAASSAVIMALAYFAYRAFPLERVSDTVSQKWMAPLIKAYFLFAGALTMGAIMGYSVEHSFVLFILGMILGAGLVHVVAEIALRQSVREMRKGLTSTAIVLAVTMVFYLGVHQDLLGYDARKPDPTKASAVRIDGDFAPHYYSADSNQNQEMKKISDPDYLEDSIALSEYLADHHKVINGFDTANGMWDESPTIYLEMEYELGEWREMRRSYRVDPKDVRPYLLPLYDHQIYWEQAFEEFVKVEPDMMKEMRWTPFLDDGVIGEQWGWYTDMGIDKNVEKPLPFEESQRMLDALQADVLDRSSKSLQSPMLGEFSFNLKENEDELYKGGGMFYSVMIYEGDRRSAAVLKDWQERGLVPDLSAMLDALGVTRLQIKDFETEELIETISDPEEIQDWILYRSVPLMRENDPILEIEDNRQAVLVRGDGVAVSEQRNILKGDGFLRPRGV